MLTRFALLTFCGALAAAAETHTLTLKQAVELALRQNPDILLARLDEQRAAQDAKVARDPFVPRAVVGSGLAWTSGFPLSIEGAAPAILQARVLQNLFNRPLSYRLAAARESARGAQFDTQARRDEVAQRTADLFLDLERAARNEDLARRQVESLDKVLETVRARVAEGRELPLEETRAKLNAARARQRSAVLAGERETSSAALAGVLGLGPADRVVPAGEARPLPDLPTSEEVLVEEALRNSRELRRLESSLLAKGLEVRSGKASRLPRIDLVAQYALLSRFNNYEDFFNRFERHNWQLGASFQLPILPGAAAAAETTRATIEEQKLKTQIAQTRNRITLDSRRALRDLREAEGARDIARLDLDLSREQLSVLLAQLEEGRATQRQIEEARFVENERWIAFHDALRTVEQARLAVLRQRGDILAALR
ncbi:MAG: TolC family protein [Bryobacteraceae bacterium]|nr:TolC family protein [Bryobacteraceae bacterium]